MIFDFWIVNVKAYSLVSSYLFLEKISSKSKYTKLRFILYVHINVVTSLFFDSAHLKGQKISYVQYCDIQVNGIGISNLNFDFNIFDFIIWCRFHQWAPFKQIHNIKLHGIGLLGKHLNLILKAQYYMYVCINKPTVVRDRKTISLLKIFNYFYRCYD